MEKHFGNKKQRSKNFSESEVITLLQIVKRYVHIIENKITNGVSNKEKKKAWEDIAAQYKTSGLTPKDCGGLKNKYQDIKKTYHKKKATMNRELYETGGGKRVPEKEVRLSAEEELLASMLIDDTISGRPSRHGGDAVS